MSVLTDHLSSGFGLEEAEQLAARAERAEKERDVEERFANDYRRLAERYREALEREIRHRMTEHEGWAGDLDEAVARALSDSLAKGNEG